MRYSFCAASTLRHAHVYFAAVVAAATPPTPSLPTAACALRVGFCVFGPLFVVGLPLFVFSDRARWRGSGNESTSPSPAPRCAALAENRKRQSRSGTKKPPS